MNGRGAGWGWERGWGAGSRGGGVYISWAPGSWSSTPLAMLLSCRRFTRYASKWMLLVMSLMFCMCVLAGRGQWQGRRAQGAEAGADPPPRAWTPAAALPIPTPLLGCPAGD